jgi:hypothetical protein
MEESKSDLEVLKYPIGKFVKPDSLQEAERVKLIEQLELLPSRLYMLSKLFDEGNLSNTYRPGSWTARQIFHHLADSHINAFTRLKLALTEDKPTIRPYDENAWAKLSDYGGSIELSLDILRSIHPIMCELYRSLSEEQWKRQYYHPANEEWNTIEQLLALYVWHGNHHEAHLKRTLEL